MYEEDVDHDVVEEKGLIDYDVNYVVKYGEFEEDMDYWVYEEGLFY